ncbi:MAG TPA: bifunctional lysylphosphatidylglycerol flippase/synthetase MprF [Phycisphaerae bacterium]|nr:bifunctional lysylphosphatidylglycerol flippase/synthetase MprF [Phycisphaerae bacterium]
MSESNAARPTAPTVPATQPTSNWKSWMPRIAGPVFALFMFVLALTALQHLLGEHHLRDILASARAIPAGHIGLAALATVLAYVALTGYDALAFLYIRRPLAYPKIALTSFVSYAFSMNLGFGPITGTAVRYRLYSGWGLGAVDVAKVVAFCGVTIWLGFLTLGGVVFLIEPTAVPTAIRLPFLTTHLLGGMFLAAVAVYLITVARMRRPLRIRGWELTAPPTGLSLSGILVSSADWALAAAVLYSLLPSTSQLSYPAFLGIFLLAQIAGLASQVPGGLGVFESAILLLLHEQADTPALAGSLLAFRGIYYLGPFGVAVLLLGSSGVLRRRAAFARWASLFSDWATPVIPPVLAFTVFVGGAILLFSGSTPTLHGRMGWLRDFLPLPVVELSHFLGSLAGAALLVLARGIQRRLDVAYPLTIALLVVGIAASLLKGLDYEEAIALAVMLVAFIPCRRHFYRKAALIGQRFTVPWAAAILIVLPCSAWLGLFSHKHIDYSSDLWWHFSYAGDASRFLRACVGITGMLVIVAGTRLLRPAPPRSRLPTADELGSASAIVSREPFTTGNFALLGDKLFLFNESRSAFIMYNVHGRSWVALGGPVGPTDAQAELVWDYLELVDRHGGRPVFYEVRPSELPVFVEAGLTPAKLGESARVALEMFSLEGKTHKELRQVVNRFGREGCVFEMIAPEEVPAILPELRGISDAWLREKNVREKRFSVGFFDEAYLAERHVKRHRLPVYPIVRDGAGSAVFLSDANDFRVDLLCLGD